MLLEGYQMFTRIANRFQPNNKFKIYFGIGYGLPLIVILFGLTCIWLSEKIFFDVLFDENSNHL
jgi:hypothetical protein